jgi:hypothetical protein
MQTNKGKSNKWSWFFNFRKFILGAAIVITRPGRQNNLSTPMDPILVLFNDEAWFNFSAYVNSQDNMYWFGENLR